MSEATAPCLQDDALCLGRERVRGLCRVHYNRTAHAVGAGKTTWDAEVAAGRALVTKAVAAHVPALAVAPLVARPKADTRRLTDERYRDLFAAQRGLCGGCWEPERQIDRRTGTTRHMVFYVHRSVGQTAALICARCDKILAEADHSTTVLARLLLLLLPTLGEPLRGVVEGHSVEDPRVYPNEVGT